MFWKEYFRPARLAEALSLKAEWGEAARWISGGTDIIIDLDRGRQPRCALIDLSGLAELNFIRLEAAGLRLGAGLTHSDLLASREVAEHCDILAQATIEVGAPQVRNRSTLAGNIVTASPAADTVPPLLALDAQVELTGLAGRRELPLADFITGFRQVGLGSNEVLSSILIPHSGPDRERRGVFLKLGLRNAQAISVISVSAVAEFESRGRIAKAALAFGSVAPTALRVAAAEALLVGQELSQELIDEVARMAQASVQPIDDLRGSAAYRRAMVKVYTGRALRYLRDRQTPPPSADRRVLLRVPEKAPARPATAPTTGDLSGTSVSLSVNGKPMTLPAGGATVLLYALREAGLTGPKEGCMEGECGACTVLLDGRAVDACLVPAAAAQNAQVTTIEGLASEGQLHPLQESFVAEGGVQCGFCTPGLVMSGSTVLAEHPGGADEWQCRSALVGNLCRCTGYTKVLAALAQSQRKAQEVGA